MTKQKQILARQRAHGDSLRQWMHDRRLAAGKRLAKARETATATSRGVDRVPARYQVHVPAAQVVVEHTDSPYRDRRAYSLSTGRRLPKSTNTPHINPARDTKRGARLRSELR